MFIIGEWINDGARKYCRVVTNAKLDSMIGIMVLFVFLLAEVKQFVVCIAN